MVAPKYTAASTRAPERPERLAYLDGLRGLAIALVLLLHSWQHMRFLLPRSLALSAYGFVAAHGSQGVSLFLVLSGMCLSYPLWKRRDAGIAQWFTPGEFFARRFLRIVPPYYVAVLLLTTSSYVLAQVHLPAAAPPGWDAPPPLSQPPDGTNVVLHLAFLHNVTRDALSIDNSFWSLGLEWQWYWAFPLILLCCIRRPWITLLGCCVVALLWHVVAADLWHEAALPARLFEFCCGVVAARLIVSRWVPRRYLLAGGIAATFIVMAAIEARWHSASYFAKYVLDGILFSCLLLLGHYSPRVNAMLSWRPLAVLGIASYSIYLVHQPVVELVELYAPLPAALRHSLLLMPVAIACGIGVGFVFHRVVERPCTDRAAWARISPALQRVFGWTNPPWSYALHVAGAARPQYDSEPGLAPTKVNVAR